MINTRDYWRLQRNLVINARDYWRLQRCTSVYHKSLPEWRKAIVQCHTEQRYSPRGYLASAAASLDGEMRPPPRPRRAAIPPLPLPPVPLPLPLPLPLLAGNGVLVGGWLVSFAAVLSFLFLERTNSLAFCLNCWALCWVLTRTCATPPDGYECVWKCMHVCGS